MEIENFNKTKEITDQLKDLYNTRSMIKDITVGLNHSSKNLEVKDYFKGDKNGFVTITNSSDGSRRRFEMPKEHIIQGMTFELMRVNKAIEDLEKEFESL